MITFLFWNIRGRSLQRSIRNLAFEYQADVVILAECAEQTGDVLLALNAEDTQYLSVFSEYDALQIFTAFPPTYISTVDETRRLSIQRVTIPGSPELLLVAVHGPSKLHFSDASQSHEATLLSKRIRDAEDSVGHRRTILIGDLNMNPFEHGLVSTAGLHAMMTRELAQRRDREVLGESYPRFYNPMWSFFGDLSEGPAGTYYYEKAEHITYFWNIFDQVLLRPDLLPFFRQENLIIAVSDREENYLTDRGIPNGREFSDHLPVIIKLEI